jgi:hypothetical protein
MSWGEEQQKEIETIRERKIIVKLSDADCDRLARKCGEHGLTIGELIENFVGDLVGGTYSNGSDERDYADQWFERCWFGMFPEPTLLNHLLNLGYEPEHYLDMLEKLEELKDMRENWKPEKESKMDEEIAILKKWVKEKENLQDFKYNLDTETLSKHLYLHLCRYSPLKELLKSVSINEDVFKHEFKVALNDFLKLNT